MEKNIELFGFLCLNLGKAFEDLLYQEYVEKKPDKGLIASLRKEVNRYLAMYYCYEQSDGDLEKVSPEDYQRNLEEIQGMRIEQLRREVDNLCVGSTFSEWAKKLIPGWK